MSHPFAGIDSKEILADADPMSNPLGHAFLLQVLLFGAGATPGLPRGLRGDRWRLLRRVNPAMDEWIPNLHDDSPDSLSLVNANELALAKRVEASLDGRPRVAIVTFFLAQPKGGVRTSH